MRFTNKGIILVVVLGTITVLSILAVAVLTIMTSEARLGIYQSNKIKAYYIGMSTLHWAYNRMKLGEDPHTDDPMATMPDGSPLPAGINSIDINVGAPTNPQTWNSNTQQIDITVQYSS